MNASILTGEELSQLKELVQDERYKVVEKLLNHVLGEAVKSLIFADKTSVLSQQGFVRGLIWASRLPAKHAEDMQTTEPEAATDVDAIFLARLLGSQ